MISELRSVTQSVHDLEKTIAFYKGAFEFETKGSGQLSISDDELKVAWRVSADTCVDYAIIGPRDDSAPVLRLLKFPEFGEKIWGDYEAFQDLGPFAVNYRIPDIKTGWKKMADHGGTPRTQPMSWDILNGVSAHESQVIDPDGVLLDVFEMYGDRVDETLGTLDSACSGVQTVAIHTADADKAKTFYLGLGYSEFYDRIFDNLEDLIHLPKSTKLRNINLMKPEITRLGRIEIAQYIGFPGNQTREKAVPPNRGVLALTFETDDLSAACDLVTDLGGTAIGGPVGVSFEPYGPVRLATFFGPDGEVLEFMQRLSS